MSMLAIEPGLPAQPPARTSPAAPPPAPPPAAPLPVDRSRRFRRRAIGFLTAAFVICSLTIATGFGLEIVGVVTDDPRPLFPIGVIVVVACALAIVHALLAVAVARPGQRLLNAFAAVMVALLGSGMTMFGIALASAMFRQSSGGRGRQVRRRGRVLLPPVAPEGSWSRLALAPTVPDTVRQGLAFQWRQNGRAEHASVAAFSRLNLKLVALGAPAELIAAAQLDGLDEIHHAETCFSLARAIDGLELGPGPFLRSGAAPRLPPLRSLALAALAIDSLLDGALHEGFSARLIAQLALHGEDPVIAAAQRGIAADEGRHAAHGWDIVRWCVAEGGAPVLAALRGARRAIPATVPTALSDLAADGSWERWGIAGRALEANCYQATRAELLERLDRLCDHSAAAVATAA